MPEPIFEECGLCGDEEWCDPDSGWCVECLHIAETGDKDPASEEELEEVCDRIRRGELVGVPKESCSRSQDW